MPQCVRIKKDGDRCKNNSRIGQTECNKHGSAPQKIAAAQRRLAEAKAAEVLADKKLWRDNSQPVLSPTVELPIVAGRMRDIFEHFGEQLNITMDCPCCGRDNIDPVVAAAFRAAAKETRECMVAIERLDLEGQRVRIEAWQSELVIRALYATLGAVFPDYTETQEILFRQTLLEKIAEIEAQPRPA